MRILLSFSMIFFLCLQGLSQNSQPLSYQSIIHFPDGRVVESQPVSVKISVFMGNAFDTVIYSETHRVTTTVTGLISVMIGNGRDKTGDFSSIDWNADKYFMRMEVETSAGGGYSDAGTMQILSIPYTVPSKSGKKSRDDLQEDQLLISRKYVGKFLDYRQTGPDDYNGPNIIWIKTTMDNTYGKISAMGKKCEFSVGDNLYIKRSYYSPGGVFGYWEYRIENDSSLYYRVSDYQYDHKVLVETWFK